MRRLTKAEVIKRLAENNEVYPVLSTSELINTVHIYVEDEGIKIFRDENEDLFTSSFFWSYVRENYSAEYLGMIAFNRMLNVKVLILNNEPKTLETKLYIMDYLYGFKTDMSRLDKLPFKKFYNMCLDIYFLLYKDFLKPEVEYAFEYLYSKTKDVISAAYLTVLTQSLPNSDVKLLPKPLIDNHILVDVAMANITLELADELLSVKTDDELFNIVNSLLDEMI